MRPDWGNLVVRGLAAVAPLLVAGCASAPPPQPAEPPPEPPAEPAPAPPRPPPELADPPDATVGLGAFVPLGGADAPSGSMSLGGEKLIPFGRGVLAVGNLLGAKEEPVPVCLFPGTTAEMCQFTRIGKWDAPRPAVVFSRSMPAQSISGWGPLTRTPQRWTAFSGGSEHVYAARKDGLVIDRIDADGKVSVVVEVPSAPAALADVRVVEISGGLVALATETVESPEGRLPELLVFPLRKDGDRFRPGEVVRTKISPWKEEDLAMDVRHRPAKGLKVTVGPWVASPSFDASGALEDAFYLAWTEATLPPRKGGTPPATKFMRTPDCGGCGCLTSRMLEDASVKKRVHVMRIDGGGKVLEDRTIKPAPPTQPEDEGRPLTSAPTLIPDKDGYLLNGQLFGRDGKLLQETPASKPAEQLAASPPLTGLTFQKVVEAAYDQTHGEGLVLLSEQGRTGAVRFDGLGRPVGQVLWQEGQPAPASPRSMARVGGEWLALDRKQDRVAILTGSGQGTTIEIPNPQGWELMGGFSTLLPVDDSFALVVRLLPPSSRGPMPPASALLFSTISPGTGSASPWEMAPDWLIGVPRLKEVWSVQREADGALVFFGRTSEGKSGLLRRDAEGVWGEVKVLKTPNRSYVFVRDVWKDRVLSFEGLVSSFFWQKGDASMTFSAAGTVTRYDTWWSTRADNTGPMLFDGAFVLGGDTFEPVTLGEEVGKHARDCRDSVATGPRRVVLVCNEGLDTDRPSTRAGLRVLRF